MRIPNTSRRAIARVITNNVMLSDNVNLPKGDYPAVVETMHIAIHGHIRDQTAGVRINLTAEFMTKLGLPPRGNLISIDIDILKWVLSGDVVEA